MPAAIEIATMIRLPSRVLITPVSAVRAVVPPVSDGPGPAARPAPGAAGAGVTTGNSRARLPFAAGADRPVTVPRANADRRVSDPIRLAAPAELLPLWPGGAGVRCEGDGDLDLLGEGDGLGQGVTFGAAAGPGEGDGLGQADLLGDGEGDGDLDGLGEGDLLGDGEGEGLVGDGLGEGALLGDADGDGELGDGDGDVVAARPVLGRRASRIPAAIAPPPAMARAPAHGRAGITPR